jgi:ribosomal protein L11 methyltransferase
MNHFQITISPVAKDISDILIALLSEKNYDGFEEQENVLLAFISETNFDEKELLAIINPFSVGFKKQLVAHRNWNADWESNYEPIIINNNVAIRATFHPPITSVAHNIIIVPKMSFGTGHHATTQMMMDAISEIDCSNKTILDYGSGTGVLAIYASYKGALQVDAIDIEPWCVENAIENIVLNKSAQIHAFLGDLDKVASNKYDIIFANINLHILLKHMADFNNLLNPNGILLMSGILDTDLSALHQKAEANGFVEKQIKKSLNWCALHMIKK